MTVLGIVISVYLVMSIIAFLAYGLDKRAATDGAWRTAEKRLHLWSLLGGFPGALAAQCVFRHKNRKRKFMIIFWLIVLLHVAAWSTGFYVRYVGLS
ncbi:MAG: DUF1294 domain-containing protein [Phycisphaerales bacterium]|nr:MAG: DUF1294 domain-containing protein [Phycisphaerales bacterium]